MACRLRIGLTGGIGSGKSEVSRLFAERGATVIDTDVIARELVEPGQPALKEIVDAFGSDMVDREGRLDRARLRAQIFTDQEKRLRLESILHPRIRTRALELADAAETPYCLLVIPLLVESGNEYPLDRILVIDTPEEIQLERASRRDDRPRQEIRTIMDNQATRQQRLSIADDVITNDGDLRQLETEVARLDQQFRQLADNRNDQASGEHGPD